MAGPEGSRAGVGPRTAGSRAGREPGGRQPRRRRSSGAPCPAGSTPRSPLAGDTPGGDQGEDVEVRSLRPATGPRAVHWDGVVGRLPADRRTVRFDQRGRGTSRALPGRYDLGQLADDLRCVVEALDPGPFVLVGHSMGGKVGQLLAARRPTGLAGVLLVAPAPPEPPAAVTPAYQAVHRKCSYHGGPWEASHEFPVIYLGKRHLAVSEVSGRCAP
ncbi:alpha/beta fold hydrolase [Kitasatospora sp. NPDC088346]|uniref:alpha/beta fold hydrolase n=1 Tax=Kitasatospora sp. NPDC088346 TaxID=3364073 RepID=UPI0038135746